MTFEQILAGEPMLIPAVYEWNTASLHQPRPSNEPLDNDIQRIIKEIELNYFIKRFSRKNKEEELSTGDTELLDEYLNSFLQAGA